MDWGKFGYLLFIIIIGYAPYKLPQKYLKDSLSSISRVTAFVLTAWFIVLSAVLLFQIKKATVHTFFPVNVIFLMTTIVWFLSPVLIRNIGVYPKEVINKRPRSVLVRLNPRTFYLKYFEVLFQQINFLFMFFIVLGALPPANRIIWFSTIIGVLHFFNIFFIPKDEGWKFFVLSIPMAVFFSWMILNGLILITASVHLLFYIVLAGYPWFRKTT